MRRRTYWPLLALIALAACREPAAPLPPGAEFSVQRGPGTLPPVLQQAATAPQLETYDVSFWVTKGTAATIRVNYRSVGEESPAASFLQFDVPKDGLVAGALGAPLKRGDSVQIRLKIDSDRFVVDFEPAGLVFSSRSPANLTFWYANANLDLNGNGVVDGSDWNMLQQLSVWYAATPTAGYKVSTKNDASQLILSAPIYHFSTYAVSW